MNLSIITVVYEDLLGLRRTETSIQSLLECPDIEVEWLIQDASVTKDISDSYTHYIGYEHRCDRGIYDGMNLAIERAKGDYLLFMNAGDEYCGESLQQLLEHINNISPSVGLFASYEVFNNKVRFKASRGISAINAGIPTHHQSIVFPRDAKIRYSLEYQVASDFAFTVSYYLADYTFIDYKVALSIFYFGGYSTDNFLVGVKNQDHIRRTMLRLPLQTIVVLRYKRLIMWWLRRNLSFVYNLIRY